MRRFITSISDTISTVFGTRPSGIVVTGLATLELRALSNARLFLVRLTGQVPACVARNARRCEQRADSVAGAVHSLGYQHCLSSMWPRLSRRPGERGATLKPF